MAATRLRFGDFLLDTANRRLLRGDQALALNARYFDALVLLVREQGRLVSKQRFFDEVWAETVVGDAALTQCIKEIRRVLGDDASAPRFVRTVAGHGYGFIAVVEAEAETHDDAPTRVTMPSDMASATTPVAAPVMVPAVPHWLQEAGAATLGGGLAGLLGGLLYGSALAFSPQAEGLGSLSVLLVLLALNLGVGMAGGAGVGLGLAAGRHLGRHAGWTLFGAALGGFVVGGVTKLLGSDAFVLLVGHAPAGTTGGLEGAALGLAVAGGLLLGGGPEARGLRAVGCAAATTGLTGALLSLAGGSLMASSLARVAETFDRSRIDLSVLGRLFGESTFGPLAQAALSGLEGALFGGLLVAALLWLRRR